MDWARQCAAVIPCCNEAATIAGLVEQVRQHLPVVFVVDDGSQDGTAEAARRAGAEVMRHERNQGKGAALAAGMRLALERGFEWALMLDGDGQHSAAEIPAFWHEAEKSLARLVVGNRMHDAARMPWLRRQVNRWMSRRLSRRAGQELLDSQCGFRLVELTAWAKLPLVTRRFEVESEMLLAFCAAGYAVSFVPIKVIYHGHGSKVHPIADTWRWFRWWRTTRP